MTVERLTSADEVMVWADAVWPQDIGALAILDPGPLVDGGGKFAIAAARRAVAARLGLVPRLRHRLYVPPAELGPPLWVDDSEFDLDNHVRALDVDPPGRERELLAAVERLRRKRLDANRPLWEMWFLTGLEDRRIAMYVRAHHAIADGMAGISILGAFLDADPDSRPAEPEPWAPAPEPSAPELLADAAARRHAARERYIHDLAHPAHALRSGLGALPALRELFAEPALPPTSLDRRVGESRTFALVRADLELMKRAAHAHGAKVNDVLLTVIAGGLRHLLLTRGESVEDGVMRVYVPVSLRHGQYTGARGNEISQMVVPLPIGIADAGDRLRLVAEETALRKKRLRPSIGGLRLNGLLGRAMINLINRQRVNVETADLPGPPVPLYLAGAPVVEIFPLLPLIGRVSLGVGGMSYAGRFNIAAVADGESQGDIQAFATGMREELDALQLKLLIPNDGAGRAVDPATAGQWARVD